MSTALLQFDAREINLIKKTIAPGTTDDQLALFVQVCSMTGLNPFARQIYAVIRNERQRDGSYEPKMTIQTSIDGYRLLAQRSGEYAGQDGPLWYDPETHEWIDVWLKDQPPAAAKVGVMRKGFAKPIYAVARFESYAARNRDGSLSNLWAKMPEVMIAKVSEALALRRAFPAELSGIYTKEEMDQADQIDQAPLPPAAVVEANGHREEPTQPSQESQIPATDQQLGSIRKLCHQLGKEDPDTTLLSYRGARKLINQLMTEYKTHAGHAPKQNGHEEASVEEVSLHLLIGKAKRRAIDLGVVATNGEGWDTMLAELAIDEITSQEDIIIINAYLDSLDRQGA